MVPYYLLLLIPFLVGVFVQAIFNHGRVNIINNRNDHKSPIVMVFFIYFILLLIFRERTVGLDLPNYHHMFYKYSGETLGSILTANVDILYKILNWIVGRFTTDFHWVMIIAAVLAVVPIFVLYNEDKRNGYLKIVLFVNTAIFMVLFSALRQAIAIGFGVWAYYFVRQKRLIPFIIVVIVAYLFHHSSFVLVFIYPLYHLRLNSKHLWIIIPVFVATYIMRETLFITATNFMTGFYDKYETAVMDTGALATFLLYIAFSVYSYVVPDEEKMTDELIGLRNYLLVSTILQSFAGINPLAMRMNYYFIVFIPYTMCKLVEIPKKSFKRVAVISRCVMCVFFTWYFINSIKDACYTRDLLGIVPYMTMWR